MYFGMYPLLVSCLEIFRGWGLNTFWRMASFKVSGTDHEKLLQTLKHCDLESSSLLLSLLKGERNHLPLYDTTNKRNPRKPRSHLQSIEATAQPHADERQEAECSSAGSIFTADSWKSKRGCCGCCCFTSLMGKPGYLLGEVFNFYFHRQNFRSGSWDDSSHAG